MVKDMKKIVIPILILAILVALYEQRSAQKKCIHNGYCHCGFYVRDDAFE